MDVTVVLVTTVLGVVGLLVIVDAWTPNAAHEESDDAVPRPVTRRGAVTERRGDAARALVAVVVFAVVVVVSGWPAPAAVIAAGAWWALGAWERQRRTDHDDIERIEALASWIENLRDVLVAGDQPVGAIAATVSTCPTPIRPQVRRLAAGLGRQEPEVVFRRFADEIDDPTGDLVAAGLLIAVRRGARTVGVLTALAEQARAQSDRRRLVEAERAPTRREVSVLTLIMGVLLVALFVLGRSEYLAAYDTAGGQVFLAMALVGYAALLMRVQRLARFPRPSRFLTSAGAVT